MTEKNRRVRIVRFLFSDAYGDFHQRILAFVWNDRDELLPFTEQGHLFEKLRQAEPAMIGVKKSRECDQLNAITTDHFRSFQSMTESKDRELLQTIEQLISASIRSIDTPQTDWRNQ